MLKCDATAVQEVLLNQMASTATAPIESIGVFVEDRLEGNTIVVRFENAAVSQPDVEYKRIARIDNNIRYTTTHHRRANRARLQILKKCFVKRHR